MKCLTPNCENPAKWRGVCWGCRDRVKRSILSGQVTEEQLIHFGLLRQLIRPNGRKPGPSVYNDLDKLAELVTSPTPPRGGSVSINPDGSFSYKEDDSE